MSRRQRRWLSLFIVASLLLAVDALLVAGGQLLQQDRQGWLWLAGRLGPQAFRLAEGISLAGVTAHSSRYLTIGVTLATFLVAAGLYVKRMPLSSAVFLADVAGAAIVVHVLKLVVTRNGPSLTPWIPAGHTFPSGTAAVSVAFFGFLGYICYQTSRRAWTGRLLTAGCVALLLGFLLSAATYHYPTEVVGGICAGFAWLALLQLAFWNPLRMEIFSRR